MLKANIIMKDGTELVDVLLFTHKEFGDSLITNKKQAEQALSESGKNIFFCGKYVQGGLIPERISDYYLYEDSESVKANLVDFVNNLSTIYDKTDIADFIFEYRDEILNIIK